jgi:hypothetical protein
VQDGAGGRRPPHQGGLRRGTRDQGLGQGDRSPQTAFGGLRDCLVGPLWVVEISADSATPLHGFDFF